MSPRLLEKCCFCIPLRRGLLVWAYVKLVISAIMLLQLMMISIRMIDHNNMSEHDSAVIFLQCVSTVIPDLLDLAFTIVLIIAAHKKHLKMIQLYYYYSITMLAIYILVILLSAFNSHRFQILHDMIFQYTWAFVFDYYSMLIAGILSISLQAYLMLLVRSEVHKLLNSDAIKEKSRQKSSASFKVIGTLPSPTPATEVVNITTDI